MGYKLTWAYIGQQKIRPTNWTPWANTVGYWKLDWDLTDEMGSYNGTVTSNATVSYESLPWDASVKCAKVYSNNWGYWISLPASIWNERWTQQTSLTFATFMKLTENYIACLLYWLAPGSWVTSNIVYSNTDGLWLWLWANGSENDDFVAYTLNTGTWYSVVWTYDHTTRAKSYYVNWALVWTVIAQNDYNTSSSPTSAFLARVNHNTCLSNAVFETNTVWDATTVQLFHNTFKSLYGLS